ncbi:MAG: M48 family metallopeptidase [Burkholderiaceae bacterium]
MQASTLTYLFVFALIIGVVLRIWLAMRQLRHVAAHRAVVPAAFESSINITAHQKAADYTTARVRLGVVDMLVGTAVLVVLTLCSGLQWLYSLAGTWLADYPFVAQLVFFGLVIAVTGLIDLPFSWYRQFHLEKRFGFNRMTPALFVGDLLKGTLIGIVIGLPLLAVVLWLMISSGNLWWLYVWLVWTAFNLVLMVLYPTVIAPRFNKFEPLPQDQLRERVEGLLNRCGFKSKGLFVMDGSKRSSHGNAYFTGFGSAKRIVFFDTLITRLNHDEIEAVLAHELGHFKHKHVLKRMIAIFLMSFVGLAFLGWISGQAWFYQGLGMTPGSIGYQAPALILFVLVLPVFTFPLRPIMSLMSRRDEFEADAFAAQQTSANHLITALVKLYEDNASTLTPDYLHSAFYDSHPPASERIGRLRLVANPG